MRFLRPALSPGIVIVLALWPCLQSGLACSVPVFRYALERWPPDPFRALVFYRGSLDTDEASLVEGLETSPANLDVLRVDLDSPGDPALAALWEEQESETLPWLYLTYPPSHPVAIELASGPLDERLVNSVLDSGLRRDIAAQLVGGETAVWVLLESGDHSRDTHAWKLLEAKLEALESSLALPQIEQADIEAGLITVPEDSLRIAFSTHRLSRDDPEDEMFVRMLLDMEDDLLDSREPMVFPIFGRGRVLHPLVGSGINGATIEQACQYLVGACSCQVKAENPGMDLLLAMNWDAAVQNVFQTDKPIPELTGIMPVAEGDDANPTLGAAPANPANPAAAPEQVGITPAATTVATQEGDDGTLILWITLPTLGLMLLLVGIGSFLLIRKKA